MLSASRVIGHREYAGPRKSDPRLDMDWRRARVAGFRPRTAGHPVIGAIRAAYDRAVLNLATWAFFLGAPRGPEVSTLDKAGRWQEFDKGAIYWHPDVDGGTAHVVWGAILQQFWAVGAELGIGWPTSDEQSTPDTVGRMNHFTGADGWPASIYWHPWTGAHVVKGAIRERWGQLGWEAGFGYPTSDERPTAGGVGRFQTFSGRGDGVETAIYWTPTTGAQPVWGAFREAWAASGWETGPWGYPASGEHVRAGVLVQDFTGGRVSLVNGRVTFEPAR